ncbi:hypothetical protein FN846DRAFT_888736 [Sphaerosporella brunnea]|uniref:Uncharacterized protein n=1 Tax=Sphaerosporella brunnea TaxID=1250544 RepID=A0A5J5F1X8_9PEZI|nr:hypothetical protein FN846DRAFT_888736 [Sphaerosporella brunnea]
MARLKRRKRHYSRGEDGKFIKPQPANDHLSALPSHLLLEINKYLGFSDCWNLAQTNKINGAVSNAHLNQRIVEDRSSRFWIPGVTYSFCPRFTLWQYSGLNDMLRPPVPMESATTLQYAIYHRDLELATKLVHAGWDVNESLRDANSRGCARSPLTMAAASGDIDLVKLLLVAGAKPEGGLPQGYNTLEVAQGEEVRRMITKAIRKLLVE